MLSPEHILRTGFGFMAAKLLLAAIELGLFTELGKGPRSGRQLRRSLGLAERTTPTLLEALVALGLLRREGDDDDAVYMNARESGQFLDRNGSSYIGDLLAGAANLRYGVWSDLAPRLRNTAPPAAAPAGHAPARDWTESVMTSSLEILAERFDFSRHTTLAEAGGRPGELSRQLTARYPRLQCRTFRLTAPDACSIPPASVIVLARLLHRYGADSKRALLAAAARVLPEAGCLIVLEPLFEDARQDDAFGLLVSLDTLLETGGQNLDFTAAEFGGCCRDAGFAHVDVMPLAWPMAALLAYP